MSPRGQDTMEKIQDFLKTKKKYEANLWNDQIGFFLITIIFLGVQILQLCSWRNFGADFFGRWMVLYWVNEKTK